jgi:hypothetical protein
MTINHPIRRFLARICSDHTMTRVVDPILADVRWERGSSWLACVALIRALAQHALMSIPDAAAGAWREDDHAMPRMALLTGAASIVFTLPLVAPAFFVPEGWPVLLLIPQGVAWTLPAVLLLAVPLALRGRPVNGRLAGRTIALSMVFVMLTFALILWIAPEANARYQQIVEGFMRTEKTAVAQFPNWSAAPASRLLDYQHSQRLAFGFAALPFALLGLGLSTLSLVRRRAWALGSAAAAAYMFAVFPLTLWTAALLLHASSVPPAVLAWGPNAFVLALGMYLLKRDRSIPRAVSR